MEQTAALFKRVYDTYGPSLYRFCLLQMKNPADAEDILQDVLIKRLYQAPKFKSPEHERNWLFQVALNLCRDEWRRHRRSELRDACREDWARQDWSDWKTFSSGYMQSEANPLWPSRLRRDGASGSFSGEAKDGVLTFCFGVDADGDTDFTAQPLTILVTPPCVRHADGTETAVTNHPAIITFQPVYNGPQALRRSLEEGDVKITATLSPFALSLEARGMGYPSYTDMVEDARLVNRDGAEQPVTPLGLTGGGSSFGPEGRPEVVSTTVHFLFLTDISSFTALRIGDRTIPLN